MVRRQQGGWGASANSNPASCSSPSWSPFTNGLRLWLGRALSIPWSSLPVLRNAAHLLLGRRRGYRRGGRRIRPRLAL
ncbi:hypothetical protein MRX96_045041 [Rhipicephalus microplus]